MTKVRITIAKDFELDDPILNPLRNESGEIPYNGEDNNEISVILEDAYRSHKGDLYIPDEFSDAKLTACMIDEEAMSPEELLMAGIESDEISINESYTSLKEKSTYSLGDLEKLYEEYKTTIKYILENKPEPLTEFYLTLLESISARYRNDFQDLENEHAAMHIISLCEVVDFLNDLSCWDSPAVRALIETRIPCDKDTAYHPHLQVREIDGESSIGFLGILNAMFRTERDGRGQITYVYKDGTKGRFVQTRELHVQTTSN